MARTDGPDLAGEFDALLLFRAVDAQRVARGLSWRGVAEAIWDQSRELNLQRHNHPISPSTLTNVGHRSNTSCQHALFMLRWIGRVPEAFVPGWKGPAPRQLPSCGPDSRLRWDLAKLGDALDSERRRQAATWAALADDLRCSPGQLRGLRRLRFATSITLAMRIVQHLQRPSSDFIYPARW